MMGDLCWQVFHSMISLAGAEPKSKVERKCQHGQSRLFAHFLRKAHGAIAVCICVKTALAGIGGRVRKSTQKKLDYGKEVNGCIRICLKSFRAWYDQQDCEHAEKHHSRDCCKWYTYDGCCKWEGA